MEKNEGHLDIGLFINLITPHDESAYDLLGWTLELFLRQSYSPPNARNNKTLPPFKVQGDLALALTNHFRAAPALIRYGASICLNTIINLSPDFLESNKHLYIYIIAGLLDSDHATAFLYECMLNVANSPNALQIHAAVSQIHRATTQIPSYDRVHISLPDWEYKDSHRSNLLDIIAKQTPPVASLILHKMANALDYMPNEAKIRQLKIIKFWGKTVEKLDSYLIQALVPLCTNLEESLQKEAIKVVQALMPSFANAPVADAAFVWSYIHPLLDSELEPVIPINFRSCSKMPCRSSSAFH